MSEIIQNHSLNNNKGILDFILKYKKQLFIVVVVAAVLSIIVSYCITPRYKSTVTLFATTSSSISQSLITESQQKKDILKFGDEEDVEQLMQVLMSSEIKNRIIEKYNLFNHYKINQESQYPVTKINKKYKSNVKISRTEFMSVQIDVFDENPDTAVLIANDIVILADSAFAKIQKDRAQKAYDIVEAEFKSQKEKIKTLEDSLSNLSKLGVIDVKSQTEMYSEQYAIALAAGNARAVEELEKKLEILATYGSIHSILKEQMIEEIKRLSIIEAKYREAKIDLEQNLPNTYVVSPAEKAERKATPVRWLIVSVSVISAFFFALILLLIFDKYRKNKFEN